jgi:hypothetical protein
MINHARTLLSNRAAADRPAPGVYGEEYTPADYVPVEDSGAMRRIRALLLGRDPDVLYLNLRMKLLLSAAHATPEVDAYFRAMDPRVTYLDGDVPVTPARRVETVSGAATPHLYGDVRADDVYGTSVYAYEVVVGHDDIHLADFSQGSRLTLALGGADPVLSCGLRVGALGAWTPATWRLMVVEPSRRGIPELLEDLRTAESSLFELMTPSDERWRRLWRYGVGATTKVAAAVAAVVAATEGARHG